jgi:hypothetical protein
VTSSRSETEDLPARGGGASGYEEAEEAPHHGADAPHGPPDGADPAGPPAVEDDPPPGTQGLRGRLRERLGLIGVVATVIGLLVAGIWIWQVSQRVSIDDASLDAPATNAVSRGGGVLKTVYASPGDSVLAHHPIAQVGNEVVTSDFSGTVTTIRQDLGAYVPSGQSVATLIDRRDLRAVGRIKEDEGLSDVHIGQRAIVTVDAFGSREFTGVVDEVSQQPREQGIAFSISDKREVREFEVKVRFNGSVPPELQQGMSARLWVYK